MGHDAADLEESEDGWGRPGPGDYSRVHVAPNWNATRNLEGEPYLLRIAVEDIDGRLAEASVPIVPVCPDDYCVCQCDEDYTLAGECPPDMDDSPPGTCD